MKNKTIFLAFSLVLAFLLSISFTACSSIGNTNNANNPNKTQNIKPNVSLTNTYFKLVSLKNTKIEIFDKEPHIIFDSQNSVKGHLGCNNFFGNFKAQNSTISFQKIASTKMMCPSIKTEDAFSKLFQKVETYEIKGETMKFFDENKNEIARFKAVYF